MCPVVRSVGRVMPRSGQTSSDIHSGSVDGASAEGKNEGQSAMKAKNSGCPSRAVHIRLLERAIFVNHTEPCPASTACTVRITGGPPFRLLISRKYRATRGERRQSRRLTAGLRICQRSHRPGGEWLSPLHQAGGSPP